MHIRHNKEIARDSLIRLNWVSCGLVKNALLFVHIPFYTHMTSSSENFSKQEKVFTEEKSSTPIGLRD